MIVTSFNQNYIDGILCSIGYPVGQWSSFALAVSSLFGKTEAISSVATGLALPVQSVQGILFGFFMEYFYINQ